MSKRKTLHTKVEETLSEIAPLFNCEFIKIPDVNQKLMWLIRVNKRFDLKPIKRPYDGTLVTPNKNYCIEVKIQYDKLKPHQADWQRKINKINNSFYVIRRKKLKDGIKFLIEKDGKVLKEYSSIEDTFNAFTKQKI